MSACGGADSPYVDVVDVNRNDNANNAHIHAEYARLEFPRLKAGATSRVLVHYDENQAVNYCTEWDDVKKSQRWSCYQMHRANLAQKTSRYESERNQYPQDELIPAEYRFEQDPYRNSGYDHGHICPSGDRLYSATANYQTFFMSNMQPQVNGFNAGVWLQMENAVRGWAKQNNYSFADTLYVCKGGTIDSPDLVHTVTGKGLIVPKYFFMAVMRVKGGQYNAMGFWVEHKSNKDKALAKYAVSIDRLEQLTGLDFFCNLPDKVENAVEAMPVNETLWGLD